MKVDTAHVPLSAYLGAVGMRRDCLVRPEPDHRAEGRRDRRGVRRQRRRRQRGRPAGEAVELSRRRHRRRRGEVRYVVEELRFDACIDYKREDVGKR